MTTHVEQRDQLIEELVLTAIPAEARKQRDELPGYLFDSMYPQYSKDKICETAVRQVFLRAIEEFKKEMPEDFYNRELFLSGFKAGVFPMHDTKEKPYSHALEYLVHKRHALQENISQAREGHHKSNSSGDTLALVDGFLTGKFSPVIIQLKETTGFNMTIQGHLNWLNYTVDVVYSTIAEALTLSMETEEEFLSSSLSSAAIYQEFLNLLQTADDAQNREKK
jgi:hypothetical protein